METTLVVMAAGMGSRYGGLKQMDGFGPNGETLLEYSVYDAMRSGFDRVVFVIRPDMEEAFNERLPEALKTAIPTSLVFQTQTLGLPEGVSVSPNRQKPWGTGQAVLAAHDAVSGPFAVINADDFYGLRAFQSMVTFLRRLQPDAAGVESALVGYRLKHTLSDHGSVSRGLCQVNAASDLLSIEEIPTITRSDEGVTGVDAAGAPRSLDGNAWVSMNFWGFAPGFLDLLAREFHAFIRAKATDLKAEFYLPAAVDAMLVRGEGTARLLPCEESWLGVTYREEAPSVRAALQELCEQGVYPDNLWASLDSSTHLLQ